MATTEDRQKTTVDIWNICECGRSLMSINEAKRGSCAACWMKTLPSDTHEAMKALIRSALKGGEGSEEENDALLSTAISKLDRDAKANIETDNQS